MGAKRLGLKIEAKRLGGKRLGGETSCYLSYEGLDGGGGGGLEFSNQ